MMVTPLVGAECLLEIAIQDFGASVSVRLLAGCWLFGVTEGHCLSKQNDRFKYFSDDRLDFMKQRVRKESGLQKLQPESYREYQQRQAVIFNL